MIKTSFLISLLTKCQTYAECGKKPKVNDARVTETCEEWSENGKCRRFSYYCEDDWATKPAAVDKDGNKVTFSSLSCMESEDLNKIEFWGGYGYSVEDGSLIECVDYADCPVFRGSNTQVSGTCVNNGSGYNDNCDLIFFNCPSGMIPSTPSVSCERTTNECCGYGAKWKFTEKKHKVHCVKETLTTEQSSTTTTPPLATKTKKCPDLPISYFDNSVNVKCKKDNSKCTYSCKSGNGKPTVQKIKCKKNKWRTQKRTATC